ncbi:MAG: uracil-DNA glycosylase [Endomicrobiales bacterium]|nr:uracil-DNA glycosylase [Endomicrobiales bacterium]
MKRSEFGKIVELTKNYIKEERNWGDSEIMVKKTSLKNKENLLEEFRKKIANCKKCPLGSTRLNMVFGAGNPKAKLMFVGEGPGYEEDHRGVPFIGRAGELLTKIIESIGLKRENVYIANVVKCHPMIDPSDPEKRGNDRPPNIDEISQCIPFLERQIEIIKPKFICVLGSTAAKSILNTETPISKLRGRFYEYKGAKLMPTFHPAALLRNASLKKDVWQDMKKLRAAMNS